MEERDAYETPIGFSNLCSPVLARSESVGDLPDSAYRILVFSPNPGHSALALKLIDQSDKGGAANNFIHTVAITKVFSREWV